MANITLFAQAINKLPNESIRAIKRQAGTDKHGNGYDTRSRLISIMFCQFPNRDPVRCDLSERPQGELGLPGHFFASTSV